jgi:hypothetical protein
LGGNDGRLFGLLAGYIDESKDSSGKLFNLTCLTGDYGAWFWIQQEWLKVIEAANARLVSQNRPTISRYHATDCSNRLGEFKGWSSQEQIDFVVPLLAIFERYRLDVVGYTVDLNDIQEVIPEAKANPGGFAYLATLWYAMDEMLARTFEREPNEQVHLFHERCDYDGTLLDAFNLRLKEKQGDGRLQRHFLSITSMGWEVCIPLQPADLIAYENLKESERQSLTRSRRKSLQVILERGLMAFSVASRGIRLSS